METVGKNVLAQIATIIPVSDDILLQAWLCLFSHGQIISSNQTLRAPPPHKTRHRLTVAFVFTGDTRLRFSKDCSSIVLSQRPTSPSSKIDFPSMTLRRFFTLSLRQFTAVIIHIGHRLQTDPLLCYQN